MNRQKLEKWNRWLDTIPYDLANMAVIREIHSGLKQIVANNENLQRPSAFYSVMHMTYSQTALMHIRRQVRRDKNSVGLIMLSSEIRANSAMVTKKFHYDLYIRNRFDESDVEVWKKFAGNVFDEYFGGDFGDRLDPKIIEQDIGELERISDASSSFTDRRLAHLDDREPSNIPLSTEIEGWCDILKSILRKYMLLLRGKDYRIETILQHDWKNIFRTAWL